MTEDESRSQGWGKSTTIDILNQIKESRDDARANAGKIYPTYVTEGEMEVLKLGNPSMVDWYDSNFVITTPRSLSIEFEVTADDHSNLLAMIKGESDEEPKEAPALNRSDRRRLRYSKTR